MSLPLEVLPSPQRCVVYFFSEGETELAPKLFSQSLVRTLQKLRTGELVLQAEAKSPLVSTAVTATCASLVYTSADLDVLNLEAD